MATLFEDGQQISLSRNDVRILVALLKANLNAYDIASQSRADQGSGGRMSNGALLPALARLRGLSFVSRTSSGIYKITPLGRQVLSWELGRLSRLIKLARSRAISQKSKLA